MFVLALLAVLSGAVIASASAAYPDPDAQAPEPGQLVQVPATATTRNNAVGQAIIADHTSVDINAIPQY